MTNQSCGAGLIGVGGEADAFGAARVRNDADEHPFGGDSRVVRDVNEDGLGVQEGGLSLTAFFFVRNVFFPFSPSLSPFPKGRRRRKRIIIKIQINERDEKIGGNGNLDDFSDLGGLFDF